MVNKDNTNEYSQKTKENAQRRRGGKKEQKTTIEVDKREKRIS